MEEGVNTNATSDQKNDPKIQYTPFSWREEADKDRDFLKEISGEFEVDEKDILSIYLHGSRSYGTHTKTSDYGKQSSKFRFNV